MVNSATIYNAISNSETLKQCNIKKSKIHIGAAINSTILNSATSGNAASNSEH